MPGGLPEVVQRFSADSSGYSAAIAAMIRDNQGLVKSIGDVQRKIKELGGDLGALSDRRIRVEVTGVDEAIGKVAALRKELDGLGDRTVHVGGDNGEMVRHLKDISTYMDIATDSMGRMEDHLRIINRNAADSSASLDQMTQMLRDNADAHNAAADAAARYASTARGGGGGDRYYIRTGGGGGSRDGGGVGPGGGGGIPGGAGAFVPWRGGGFQAVKFWGMAAAEFMATAVPALIAAGSAAAVGMQGAQDVMVRTKAIGAAAESIGPAFGQSTSSYLGLPGTLSQYQDAARGGVYELGGAGINFARMGKGTFGQMGVNTLSMIDRGTANMLINYQKRQAAGGGMGDMLGGGTEWLRRYGDLFSNLGNTVMNLAPYEPGIGGDVLNSLVGGTGALKQVTQDVPGPLLGAIMAAEGGSRWGKAILGGKGLLGRVLGLGKAGGIGGLLSKGGEGLFARGMGGVLGDAGLGMMGAGDALAGLGFPELAAISAAAYGYDKLLTYQSPTQRAIGGLQKQIGQGGFSAAFTPLAGAIVKAQGLGTPYGTEQAALASGGGVIGARGMILGGNNRQQWEAAATGFTQTAADLVNAGPQLVSALKKAGLKGVSMADAFQIAQNALLDTSHAFGKDGKLSKTAVQMLMNYGAAIKPMTQSAGGFNAAIAAGQIMGSPAMKSLSQVNQSLDSMTQVMTGGPAGMAALMGMLGGTPITHKLTKAGLQLSAPPAFSKMAGALTSFTSAGGAAAWNTFAGSSGLVAAEQQNLDQLRTYMTLGALPLQGKTGAQGIAGFQLMQMLPLASKSPAALAMLMQQGSQMGIGGYYDPAKSQKQNYQAEENALAKMAGSAAQINKGMNNAVIASSNLPRTASQFSQAVGADLQSKIAAAASSDVVKLKSTLGHAGSSALIGDLVSQFKTAGFQAGPALMSGINATLKGAGFSGAQIRAIDVKVKADTSQAQSQINGIHGKTVHVPTHADVAAAQSAINSIHGKTVTVTVVENILAGNVSIPGAGPGGVPYTPAGVAANAPGVFTHRAAGGRIPGYGGGDIVPVMAEPGELILPKHASADPVAAYLAAKYRVPGYAGGGFVGQQVSGPMAYWGAGSSMAMWNPALYAQILAAMRASQGEGAFSGPQGRWLMPGGGGGNVTVHPGVPHGTARQAGSRLSVEILKGITDGIKNAKPEAAAAAKAMVAKIGQEIAYAKQATANLTAGLNFGGLDTTQGPVQTQMQSYADSLKTFAGDIKAMSKGGLNKDLLRQMIAAGPVQGDALAQSIGQGPGGIKAVNHLYASIQQMSKGIGAQAAGAIFGGTLAPNLKSGTFTTNNVSISVNLSGGKGGGDLQLSNAQISQLVALIQKKLLQQAKRNNKTGVKLPGKGS